MTLGRGCAEAWCGSLGTVRRAQTRTGSRLRTVSTPAGDVEAKIPKLQKGTFSPELLEPRRRIDWILWGVIMTAFVTDTSTRKVKVSSMPWAVIHRVPFDSIADMCGHRP